MKKIIIKSFAILSVVLVAAGCIKETFPKGGSITTEQQMASPNALQYMVSGIPAAMMASGTAGYASSYGAHFDYGIPAIHMMTESMLEDLTVSGDLGYFWFGAYFQNLSMGADYIYNAYFWDCYYAWIKLANDVILMAGDVDEADATVKHSVGQAYAYRAMCYLDLARLYEPKQNSLAPVPDAVLGLTVPIVKEDIVEEVAKNNPRATREEMYEFIFEDLAKALEYLDPAMSTYNSPNAGAVYGMYARAYQELGGTYHELGNKAQADANYLKAAEYARKAIEVSGRTPLTQAQWLDPKSGFNDGSANNAWMWGLTLSVENASNIITSIAHLAPEAIWGYSVLSLPSINKALYERIDVNDFRKKAWLDPEYTWNPYNENYNPSNGYQFAGMDDPLAGYEQYGITNAYQYFMNFTAPYVNLKFRPASGQCVEYTEGNVADHVLMRVEEMYFIEIEAVLRTKGVGEAQKLLNSFMRTYRYSSYDCSYATSESSFIQEMILQKRIEFWGEGVLFYDYKRLNQSIVRGYPGTNFPAVARFNTEGRSPQWNIVITRGEIQANPALEGLNNPDPTEKLIPWKE